MAVSSIASLQSSLRPPVVDLLQTNLRLLDLDRKDDFPPIVFSAKDAKARIRCTEWVLYRLFELWDPEETRDRLSPFFPPLEPLQSLNLRNALHRGLTDLKKNGVLGRETVLRKTMLDDCKGDKLIELMVLFSTTVLKKVVVPRYGRRNKENGRPTAALRVATAPMLDAAAQGSLIPLAIAHRGSLNTLLKQKAEHKSRCNRFDEMLEQKTAQLTERAQACEMAPPPSFSQGEAAQIKSEVRANWMGGNSKWPQTLLYGDDINASDALLTKPFHEIWGAVVQGGTLAADASRIGLVENLERRVRSQNARLLRWKEFRQELAESARSTSSVTTHARLGAERGPASHAFDFQRHVDLRLGRPVPENPDARAPVRGSKYQDIVQDMQLALANASRSKRVRPIEPIQKPVERVVPKQPERPVSHLRTLSLTSRLEQRLANQQRFPPPMTADVPLSSIFSPAKSTTNGAGQPRKIFRASTQLQLQLGSPIEPPSKTSSPSQTPDIADYITSTLSGPPSDDTTLVGSSQNGDDPAEMIISSVINAPETPVASHQYNSNRMSLTERTRMSIMRTTAPFLKQDLQSVRESSKETSSATSVIANGPSVADRRASLLERTQQSMTAAAQQAPQNKRLSINLANKIKRQSLSSFPVNQFETPGRPRPEPRRDATPTERLYADDAQYESVFKSRPRIMLSPVPTPREEDEDNLPTVGYEEGGSEIGMDDDDDDDIDGDSWIRSSPLRGRG